MLEERSPIVCPTCATPQRAPDDAFCTNCGSPLTTEPAGLASSARPLGLVRQADAAPRAPSGSLVPWLCVAAAALVAVAFAGLWRVEAGRHGATREKLRDSQANVAELRLVQTRLADSLKAEMNLSSRRADVIRRARAVLSSVSPLLESVDEMKALTAKIQTGRDDFASASARLVGDLVALGNYLVDTSGSTPDYSYLSSTIDDINSEISSVSGYGDALSSYDARYSTASDRFERRANDLASSVRALNGQLTKLAGGS